MKIQVFAVLIALAAVIPMSAIAFECPKIGKQAQAQIDKAGGMAKGKMSMKGIESVMVLLAQARSDLAGGLALHSGAHGKADHALSVAKIKSASGHAYAAASLLKRL